MKNLRVSLWVVLFSLIAFAATIFPLEIVADNYSDEFDIGTRDQKIIDSCGKVKLKVTRVSGGFVRLKWFNSVNVGKEHKIRYKPKTIKSPCVRAYVKGLKAGARIRVDVSISDSQGGNVPGTFPIIKEDF